MLLIEQKFREFRWLSRQVYDQTITRYIRFLYKRTLIFTMHSIHLQNTMRITRLSAALIQILLGIITTIPLVSASPFYALTILDALDGSHGGAYGINNRGQIVGWSHTSDNSTHATLWNDARPTSLAMLSTTNASVAFDINDSGQIVGVSFNANLGGNNRATLWEGSNVTDLGKDNGFSVAYGINNFGQIVGASDFPGVAGTHAALWEYGLVTDLGSLGGVVV